MSNRRGFTLVELLMGLIVMGLVAGMISRVFITQQRLTVAQVEQASMQANVRTGTLILANELREMATGVSGGADIKSFTSTQLTYRAMRSLAVACRVTTGSVRIRTTPIYGARPITAVRDSLMIYVENNPGPGDDEWVSVPITGISASTCPDGAPAYRLAISGLPVVPSQIITDAPVRTFEIMQIAPVIAGGHNWLGARSRTDPADPPLTPVAGPITIAGLSFSYLDLNGNVTGSRNNIRSIKITLRGQSDWDVRPGSTLSVPLQPLLDSLVTIVTLRNAHWP